MHKLRDYQHITIDTTHHLLYDQGKSSVLNVLATGMGKTVIAIEFIKRYINLKKQRVLIIAQDTLLVKQMHSRLKQTYPALAVQAYTRFQYPGLGMVMNSHVASNARCVVATRQTLAANDFARLKELLKYGAIDAVIIDEADQSITEEHINIGDVIRADNPDCKIVGFTATASRSDGRSMGVRFDAIGSEYNIAYGVIHGWLKPVKSFRVKAVLPDAKNATPLSVANWRDVHFDTWRDIGGERKSAIHFFPTLDFGRNYCRFLQERGYPAVHIDAYQCIDLLGRTYEDVGISRTKHREQVLDSLQSGDAIYATNKNVLSRGFDWRHCNLIFNSVSTESDSTFTQRFGRVTRLPQGLSQMREDSYGYWSYRTDDGVEHAGLTLAQLRGQGIDPYGYFYDFSNSTAQLLHMASLMGQETVTEHQLEKPLEEEAEVIEVVLPKEPTNRLAVDVDVKQRQTRQSFGPQWYVDALGNMSATYGKGVPFSVFLSGRNLSMAKRISEQLEGFAPESLEHQSLTTLYDILSNHVLWLVEGQVNGRGYVKWNTMRPVASVYGDEVAGAYDRLERAVNVTDFVFNAYITEIRRAYPGFSVDIGNLRRLKRSPYLPSDKQLNYLNTLVTAILPKHGLKHMQYETPLNSYTAKQAIEHFQIMQLYLNQLKTIKQEKIPISVIGTGV